MAEILPFPEARWRSEPYTPEADDAPRTWVRVPGLPPEIEYSYLTLADARLLHDRCASAISYLETRAARGGR